MELNEKGCHWGGQPFLARGPSCEAIRQREGRERLLSSSAACLNDRRRRLTLAQWSFADASSEANGKNNRTNCNQELFHDAPVCTENLNPDVMVMKSTEDRV